MRRINIRNKNYNGSSMVQTILLPAEREKFPALTQNIFSLLSDNGSISKTMIDFGAKFEQARLAVRKFHVPFLKAAYEYSGGQDFVIPDSGNAVRLHRASKLEQTLIPMLLIIEYYINHKSNENIIRTFEIEEPELNLDATFQFELVKYLKEKIVSNNHQLILSTLNNETIT